MAKELGKEAGLFVPTGSMGNLISVMVHCWGRGQEIILGDRSHIHLYEQGTIAQFGGGESKNAIYRPNSNSAEFRTWVVLNYSSYVVLG